MPEIRSRRHRPPVLLAGLAALLLSAIWDLGAAPFHVAGAAAQTAPAEIGGDLGRGDVRRAIETFTELGKFYGTLAENDPNRHAAQFWENTADTYQQAGLALSALEKRGAIRIEDLAGDTASRLEAGAIVLNRRLGGQWQSRFVEATRRGGGDDWGYISQLSTVLLGDLFRLQPVAGQSWFQGHRLRSSLASAAAADNPALTRHLTSFWHLKDKYLWVAMARDDAGSNPPRLGDARKVHLFSEMTTVTKQMERDLGAEWPNRLSRDWREFDRLVDRFSAKRGWLTATRGAGAAEALLGTSITQMPENLAATEHAPAASAISSQRVQAAEPAAPSTPEESVAAAVAPDPQLEEKVYRLTKELETNRRENVQIKDSRDALSAALDEASKSQEQVAAELASARQQVAALQQQIETARRSAAAEASVLEAQLTADLAASRAESAAAEDRLSAELETSRTTIASLRQELETERAASRQKTSSLEARHTADLESSRAEVAEVKARLTAELENSRTTIVSLHQELEAGRSASRERVASLEARLAAGLDEIRTEAAAAKERLTGELETSRAAVASLEQQLEADRATGQEKSSSLEARLTADLEATRKLASRREQRLSEELAASRRGLADLEAALESERAAVQQEAARRAVKLGDKLKASEQTVTALREQVAVERDAAQQKLAGLRGQFDADLKAAQQTAAALRQRTEAERAAAEQKLASLETLVSSEPQKVQRESAALAERLTGELETSRQEIAGLREQLVSLKRPAAGLNQDPWIAITTVMMLVILGLIAWTLVLWRHRSTVVMPDFAAAGAGGVPTSLGIGAVGRNGRSAAPARAGPSALKAPGEAAKEASPQLLIEALRQGNAALFESRFSAMTGLEGERLRTVIYSGVGEELVVACRALGIDKLVFASIFLLSRKCQSDGEELSPRDLSRVMASYDGLTEDAARILLEAWRQTAGPDETAETGEGGKAGEDEGG